MGLPQLGLIQCSYPQLGFISGTHIHTRDSTALIFTLRISYSVTIAALTHHSFLELMFVTNFLFLRSLSLLILHPHTKNSFSVPAFGTKSCHTSFSNHNQHDAQKHYSYSHVHHSHSHSTPHTHSQYSQSGIISTLNGYFQASLHSFSLTQASPSRLTLLTHTHTRPSPKRPRPGPIRTRPRPRRTFRKSAQVF